MAAEFIVEITRRRQDGSRCYSQFRGSKLSVQEGLGSKSQEAHLPLGCNIS